MTSITNALSGVRLGPAVARRNLTMIPLVRSTPADLPPASYLPLDAAIAGGVAEVTEISESGSVPTLALRNDGDTAVLVIDGEELVGARQNRIVNLTILAPPKRVLPIPVSCVERGRWAYRSQSFQSAPRTMAYSSRARKTVDVNHSLDVKADRSTKQDLVWRDVDQLMCLYDLASPTSAMSDVYEQKADSIDTYLEGVEPVEGQVGVVFAIDGRPVGVELFDQEDTLRAYLPKVVRSYALDALGSRDVQASELPALDADAFVAAVTAAPAKSFEAVGLGEELRIETDAIVGGALALDGRVVHLCAFARVT